MYIVSLTGVTLSFVQGKGAFPEWDETGSGAFADKTDTELIIAVLVVAVLISLALLLALSNKSGVSRIMTVCAFVVTAWAVGPALLPMSVATVLSFNVTARQGLKIIFIQAFCVCAVCMLIFRPGAIVVITTILLLGLSLYVLRLMARTEKIEQQLDENANRVEEMQELLGNQRRMVRNMEHVSRLEERNRLAARIHDEIGHGMSGGILLLEGALLVMDKEPEKAREMIRNVTENLRGSVEEVRKVLRDERSVGAEVSLARIKNELSTFEANHAHIKTLLTIEGDMDSVNGAIWACVYENMVEALTNVLKHSSATLFTVSIKNNGSLLRVEFADNGSAGKGEPVRGPDNGDPQKWPKEIRPGIGLQNMEERASMGYGRCFFRHEQDGFHVLMTFPWRKTNG